jgi:hypothetical protein
MRALLCVLLLCCCALGQTTPLATTGKFPPLKVQVSIGTAQRRIGDSYRKTMEIQPKVAIEGVSRISPIPAGEATMLIITMDTRAKYTAKKEIYKVHSAETLPLLAAVTGERRQLSFAESSVTFDSYRDSSNIGGDVYKYYVFGIRDAETKTIVEFQTNNTQLAALCKAQPEKRDEFLKLSTGAKFPTEFR